MEESTEPETHQTRTNPSTATLWWSVAVEKSTPTFVAVDNGGVMIFYI